MNDIPMFLTTPNSYAVENAPEAVRTKAAHTVMGPKIKHFSPCLLRLKVAATTAQRLFALAVLNNLKYYHYVPSDTRHLFQTADAAKIDAEIRGRLEQLKNKKDSVASKSVCGWLCGHKHLRRLRFQARTFIALA